MRDGDLLVYRCNGCGRVELRYADDGEPPACVGPNRVQASGSFRWQWVGVLHPENVNQEGPSDPGPPQTEGTFGR